MSDTRIQITAAIDDRKTKQLINQEIAKIQAGLKPLNLKVDMSGASKTVDKEFKQIDRQINDFKRKMSNTFKELEAGNRIQFDVKLIKVDDITNIQQALGGLSASSNQLASDTSATSRETLSMKQAMNVAKSASDFLALAFEKLGLAFLSNPIGIVIAALSTLAEIVIWNKQKQEELIQQNLKSATTFQNEMNQIDSLTTQYVTLASKTNLSADEKKTLYQVEGDLKKKLNDTTDSINTQNNSLDDNIKKIQELTGAKLKNYLADNQLAYEKANDFLNNEYHPSFLRIDLPRPEGRNPEEYLTYLREEEQYANKNVKRYGRQWYPDSVRQEMSDEAQELEESIQKQKTIRAGFKNAEKLSNDLEKKKKDTAKEKDKKHPKEKDGEPGSPVSSNQNIYDIYVYEAALAELDKELKSLQYQQGLLSKSSSEYRDNIQQQISVMQLDQIAMHDNADALRAKRSAYSEGSDEYKEFTTRIDSLGESWRGLSKNINDLEMETANSRFAEMDGLIATSTNNIELMKTKLEGLSKGSQEYVSLQGDIAKAEATHIQLMQQKLAQYKIELLNEKLSIAQKDELKTKIQELNLEIAQSQSQLKSELAAQADELISLYKDGYGKLKDAAVEAIDQQIDAEEKRHNQVKDNLKDEEDLYEDLIQTKIKSIDTTEKELDYQDELSDLEKERQKIQDQINALSLDDSYEAKTKVSDLNNQLGDIDTQIERKQRDHDTDTRKTALEAQLDAYKQDVEAKQKAEDEKYQAEKERLENIKKETQKYYDDIINNEAYWMQVRDEIMSGSITKVQTEFSTLTSSMQSNLAVIGNGIYDNLVTKMQLGLQSIKQLQSAVNAAAGGSSDNGGNTGGDGSSSGSGKITNGMYFTDAAQLAGVNVSYDKDRNEVIVGNRAFPPGKVPGTYLNSSNRLIVNDPQIVKDLLQSEGGNVKNLHQGGIIGDTPSRWATLTHNLFNVAPNEQIRKLLEDEVVIRPNAFRTNFIPNIRGILTSTANNSGIVNNYELNISIAGLNGDKKSVDYLFTEINKGLHKIGQ